MAVSVTLEIFQRFRWKPIIALHTTQEQIVLTEQSWHYGGILFMKTFYNKVNSVICFAKETRTSIVLIIEWVQSVLQNFEKPHSVRGT